MYKLIKFILLHVQLIIPRSLATSQTQEYGYVEKKLSRYVPMLRVHEIAKERKKRKLHAFPSIIYVLNKAQNIREQILITTHRKTDFQILLNQTKLGLHYHSSDFLV